MAGTGGSGWREGKGPMVGDRDRCIAAKMRRPLAAQHFRGRSRHGAGRPPPAIRDRPERPMT